MSHKIRIQPRQKINKDGSEGTKKEYVVTDKPTGRPRVVVGVVTSQRAAETLRDAYRERLVVDHIRRHPDDTHFIRKHFGKKAN